MGADMIPKQPPGSEIVLDYAGADRRIVIPSPSASWSRYPAVAFLLFWLGGWFFGFKSVLNTIQAGTAPLFLYFWLGGWTIGGAAAVFFIYTLFRPAIDESLTLAKGKLIYDPGRAPYQGGYEEQKQAWRAFLPRKKPTEFNRSDLQTLRLRETENGNRLTIDSGATRIELANAASEVEREWLYKVIAKHYALPTPAETSPPANDTKEVQTIW